jgi:hypothetical protein
MHGTVSEHGQVEKQVESICDLKYSSLDRCVVICNSLICVSEEIGPHCETGESDVCVKDSWQNRFLTFLSFVVHPFKEPE